MSWTVGLWVIDGAGAALVIAGTVYVFLSRRFDSHAVASRLDFRIASRRTKQLLTSGEFRQAHAVIQAMLAWLREQVHLGPARRRVARAAELEQWELVEERVRVRIDSAASSD